METPLLFLTSTSAVVPTGRNARTKARSDMARQSGAQGPVHGTVSSIPVTPQPHAATTKQGNGSNGDDSSELLRTRRRARNQSLTQRQQSAPHNQLSNTTSLQIVCLQPLLVQATAKIRAVLAKACQVEPSLHREALRCRPWTRADFAHGMFKSTPVLSSTVAYLEHRLSLTDRTTALDVVGMGKYSSALMHLREAVRDRDRRVHASTLAASHILAMCAMFDFGQSTEWTKLVEGVVVVIKFQSEHSDVGSRRHIWSHAGPVMIQAFMTHQQQAVLDQTWVQVLENAGHEMYIPYEDAQNFVSSAQLVLTYSSHGLAVPHSGRVSGGGDFALQKARDVRARIRETLLRDLHSPRPVEFRCFGRELWDERLAVMLGLDDFMYRLGLNVEDMRLLIVDSQALCQQVMATDVMIGPTPLGDC